MLHFLTSKLVAMTSQYQYKLALTTPLILGLFFLAGCQGLGTSPTATTPPPVQLTVTGPTTATGTVTSSPAGINCPGTCSASFAANTQVTLTEKPTTNNFFSGWSGGSCSGTASTCVVTLTAATSISAAFNGGDSLTVAVTGTGTVTSSPAGITCPGTCTANFGANTKITLTEAPGSGQYFSGWSGSGCSGTATTCAVTLAANSNVSVSFAGGVAMTVALAGVGTGTVTSTPSGISCSATTTTTCTASFAPNTPVTLSETPITGDTFAGWSGACTGTAGCSVTLTAASNVTATFGGSLANNINHIILFAQENRSLDHYFGQMMAYWSANGYGTSGQTFDGLPANASNPGCPPGTYGGACGNSGIDTGNPIASFHFQSMCQENQSPFWNEAHDQWDPADPTGSNAADLQNPPLTGFVWTAAYDSQDFFFMDVLGIRSMGYFDGSDLNLYYFLASNFATSDRWFAPVMSRTQVNRMYLLAATSEGHAYPINDGISQSNPNAMCGTVLCSQQLNATTIFEELQNAGVSWKIYMDPTGLNDTSGQSCTNMPQGSELSACIAENSYINEFTYEETILNSPTLLQNMQPISQFKADADAGTLPSFALIEPASNAGLDEHPSDYDEYPVNVQSGQNYAYNNVFEPLLTSQSWNDTALIFSFDEWGGYYDHVPPQAMAPPGSTSSDPAYPVDLDPTDICMKSTGQLGTGMCTFGWTGYRVPAVIVSPFSGKNYVSHTVRDTTSVLNLVEERFGVAALTGRDAAQPKMDEFFNFATPAWTTAPTLPGPNTSGTCDLVPPASWNDPATLTVDVNIAGIGTVSSTPAGINSCGGVHNEDCEYTFTSGTSITLTATPAAGHTFTSWGIGGGDPNYTCDGSTNPVCTFNMAGPMEAVANFQ